MSGQAELGRRIVLAGAAAGVVAGRPIAARAQARTIRIGVLTDLSGPYRDTGGPTSVAAARQAVEDFGTSHGITAEVVAADHQQKPDVAVSIVREWFDRGGVDAVADVNNSAIAFAVTDLAQTTRPRAAQHRRLFGRHHRTTLQPEPGALGFGLLADRQDHGDRPGEYGQDQVVRHNGRLRVRCRHAAGPDELHRQHRRDARRGGQIPVPRHERLLVLLAAGANVRRQCGRIRQRGGGLRELGQAKPGIRSADRKGSRSPGLWSSSPTSTRSACRWRRGCG